MWFGEPHPFPERGSPTKLSASGEQRYEGWSCRLWIFEFQARICTEDPSMGQIKHLCSSSRKRKRLFSVRFVRVVMRRKLWTCWKNQVWDLNEKTLHRPGHNLSGQSSVSHLGELDASATSAHMFFLRWKIWVFSDYFSSNLSFITTS